MRDSCVRWKGHEVHEFEAGFDDFSLGDGEVNLCLGHGSLKNRHLGMGGQGLALHGLADFQDRFGGLDVNDSQLDLTHGPGVAGVGDADVAAQLLAGAFKQPTAAACVGPWRFARP